LVDDPAQHLPRAKVVKPVHPQAEGAVAAIDSRALGLAVVGLGGGRTRAEDAIDHSVGLTELAGLGDEVGSKPLCMVHARDEDSATAAAETVRAAYRLGQPPAQRRLIYERIGGEAR
jgi:thymidine phosphorylase